MKKSMAMALLLFLLLAVQCHASSVNPLVEEGLEQFGADRLVEQLPQSATEFTEQAGWDKLNFGSILSMTPGEFFLVLKQGIAIQLTQAKSSLFAIIGAVLLCAALGCLGMEAGAAPVFEVAAVLSVTAVLSRPVIACVQEASSTIGEASRFLLSYVPIYTTVITAGGMPLSAASYHVLVMAAAQVAAQFAAAVLIPLCGIYLALCLAGGVGQNQGVSGLASAIKRLINWSLVLTMTVFVGILSLQGFMSSAADGAAVKTTKFLVGTFVPVVGSAISDALMAAQGSIRVIKATVGSFGVAVAVLTFLPALIKVTVLRVVIALASAAGEMLSVKQVREILSGFANVLSILTAMLLSMAMLMIISTAVMLSLGGNA